MKVLLLALAGCPKPLEIPETVVPPVVEASVKPRLLVEIVVDQLPIRLFEAPRSLYTGGLARLSGPEAFTAVGRYAHAITFTCPGHATISTGAAPSVSGIVSNDWYVPGEPEGERVYCGDAAFLRVPTLADQVLGNGGQVAALSIKDRGARMLGGTKGTLVAWFDKKALTFTEPLASLDLAKWQSMEWTALYPDVYAERVGPDQGPFEGDPGNGTTFPHPATAFLYTPYAGSALTDAAIAAADQLALGTDDVPDLLAVSYSEIDYIGHAFSSESWESLDAMVRLDQDLGRLFEHLDATVGRDRYTVLLSSDHGSARTGGPRVKAGAVEAAAAAALAASNPPGMQTGTVVWEDPGLWLPPAVRADPAKRAVAAAAVADAVRAVPGIGGAWAWRDLPVDGPYAEAVKLSLDEERSGDVYVMLAPGALYDYEGSEGKGTSHGTPYDDDVLVPILAWGVGVAPGVAPAPSDMRSIAPTAAALLGIAPPSGATAGPVPGLLLSGTK